MTPAGGPYHQAAAAPDHQVATTVVKRIVVHGEMGTKPSAEVSDDHKKCSSCGKAKPIEGFSGECEMACLTLGSSLFGQVVQHAIHAAFINVASAQQSFLHITRLSRHCS